MSHSVESRLRRFLLQLSAFICAGTIVELLLVEHTGSWVQFVPIVAAGAGSAGSLAALRGLPDLPAGRSRLAFRGIMLVLIIVSVVGVFQHVRANYLFVREIKPAGIAWDAFLEALTGASPLLASGILALAGLCGWMATVRGPFTNQNQDSVG
jgi:hypothetical protein